jgi:hypothetical protein
VKRPVPAFSKISALSRWALSLSLAAPLFVGCTDEPGGTGLTFDACAPLDIGVSPALTGEQMQGVTDALAMWNQAAGTALAVPTPTSTAPLIPLTFQGAAPPFHGFYDDHAGQIFVNQDLIDVAPLRITIAHEIGHAFGLAHVSASVRPSLMNSGNTTIPITPADVGALAAIWGRCPTPTSAPGSEP